MLQKKRIGVNIFYRGMKGGIRSSSTPVYDVSLYELLKSYSSIKMQQSFQSINIPKLPVFTTEEAIKQIRANFQKILEWKSIKDLIPTYLLKNKKLKNTGIAGIFAAGLELTKEGAVRLSQKKNFDTLLIKKTPND